MLRTIEALSKAENRPWFCWQTDGMLEWSSRFSRSTFGQYVGNCAMTERSSPMPMYAMKNMLEIGGSVRVLGCE